ncbi:hypothetical protein [Plantactinospora endophytica]|uniref:DUF4235 domain-containing protein n=1 Tax=Plantactinospora endophytica TaxID=673535 RepID=A0ABQ4E114_9ACTN|nr:hypothetical protein [Plantactinospora endophytica]GIG88368.1 hypothetical protein Pen02_33040 [Plantactinospora endophytica]
MSERHTVLRSMHDLGLAAWFGGSLMGAVGVNGAAAKVSDSRQRLGVASAGWARWTPVNAAAIGTHVAGAAGELITESPRMLVQSGVGKMSAVKTGLTVAALAVTGYSRLLGMQLQKSSEAPVVATTAPENGTPRDVAARQRQLRVLQWVIPALTGGLIVVTALAGEQQKPGQVYRGVLARMSGIGRRSRGLQQMTAGGMAARRIRGMAGKGMGGMAGKGMGGMAGKGMGGMAGKAMHGMAGKGMGGMVGRGMSGMTGRGMNGMAGKGRSGMTGEGVRAVLTRATSGMAGMRVARMAVAKLRH